MIEYNDLNNSIVSIIGSLDKIKKTPKLYNDNKVIIEFLQTAYNVYWSQIHEYLTYKKNERAETEIRKHISTINSKFLPFVKDKLESNSKNNDIFTEYFKIYDDFYALVSYRSLEHFALYSEWANGGSGKTHWKDTLPIFNGYWYYAGKMVLSNEVQFLSKQLPTGYGKTYSDVIHISFIFGNDINDDVLKVFGASDNVSTFTQGIADIMSKPFYSKVFPYYRQFDGSIDNMFSVKQIKDSGSKLRIVGSARMNLRVVSKEKNTNGVRCRWLFIDDITQMIDAYSLNAHKKDISKFSNEWYKRNYNLNTFKIVAGGTTYSNDDILCFLLIQNDFDSAELANIKGKIFNKYTFIGKSNFIIDEGTSVFIRVPKLDYDTDESTFPQNYPTEKARRERINANDDGKMFAAMEQQIPMPNKNAPFTYESIKTYNEKTLPLKESDGGNRSNYCKAALDLPRTGKNNVSMGILSKCNELHYLIDFYYNKKPLDFKFPNGNDIIDDICIKIIAHNVNELAVEGNTNSNIADQIYTRLREKYGFVNIKIDQIYSTKNKMDKIYSVTGTILSYIRFPERNMFAPSSMMGKAMRDINYFDGDGKKDDDAPDTLAIYVLKFLKTTNKPQVEILRRRVR